MLMPLSLTLSDERRCQHCNEHVPQNFRRVYGDKHDIAHRCFACDSYIRISQGTAAGLSVHVPDPDQYSYRRREDLR